MILAYVFWKILPVKGLPALRFAYSINDDGKIVRLTLDKYKDHPSILAIYIIHLINDIPSVKYNLQNLTLRI